MEEPPNNFKFLIELAERFRLIEKIDHFSNNRKCADWIHTVIEKLQTTLNELNRLSKVHPSKREEIKAQKLMDFFEQRKQIPSDIITHFESKKGGEYSKEFDRLLTKAIEIVKNNIDCEEITNEALHKLLRELQCEFKKNKKNIHPFPHPLKDFIRLKGWKIVLLLCALGSVGFYLYDRYKVVSDMENSCEIPLYRSLEWINFQPYKSIMGQSKIISGSCYIKKYNSIKNKPDLDKAATVFGILHKENPKSLQATFFMEYINNLKGSSITYENSINLARQTYLTNNNYPLTEEELDIVIKLSHIFMMQKNYREANESFKYILRKKPNILFNNSEEDFNNRNVLLGICATHFNGKDNEKEQNEGSLSNILTQCRDAIEILNKEKSTNQQKKDSKDDLTKKLAIAYYNQGCVEMRLEHYTQAQISLKAASQLVWEDDKLIKENFTIALILVNILIGENKEAITIANEYKIEQDFAPTTYQTNILLGLGIAHFAIASDSRSGSDESRKSHYRESFAIFDRLRMKKSTEKYLLKSEECKDSLKSKKCSDQLIPSKDPDLIENIHTKFSAYINHYELNPIVASAPMPNKNKNTPKDKNNNQILDACTRLNKSTINTK